ncbi:MAG TPA: DUF5050 domain-containing protein [Oscillospiraceae bacterium]|nr:DUF5050 domain-containing protein [Oscillospiraceae bacterium]HPF56414.1 DUF5050 domain-containing protein [Clostridiales bacterium]HPK36170.1 DUF5050 domain-containing protein [Oscillospiraceae bacterium]HPR76208.1 DUF5050 domain-containing protein [Oscillospiraceae bacterium]
MMKKFVSVLMVILFGFTCAACGTTSSETSSVTSETPEMVESTLSDFDASAYGTYPSNLSIGGGAVTDGNCIYYSRLDYYSVDAKEYRLWKYDFATEEHSQVTEFRTDYLNYYNSRLFYIKNADKFVYSMNTDGSGITQLTQETVNKLLVYEGKLYCLTDSELYTIASDGTGKSVLYSGKCTGLYFDGGTTYIITDENQVCVLTDGTATPIEGVFAYSIVVNNGWIYYLNVNDSSLVYKVRTDGTDLRKLYSGTSENLLIADGMLYFVSIEIGYNIIRIDCNGNSKVLVNYDRANSINVIGDYMLYTDMRSGDLRLMEIGKNSASDFLYM